MDRSNEWNGKGLQQMNKGNRECPTGVTSRNTDESCLGRLGNLIHYRCRYCGANFSKPVEKPRKRRKA